MKRFVLTAAVLSPLFFFSACNPSKNPAASAATITASPNPVPAGEGLGKTTITWNTGDGTVGQVYVSADGEPDVLWLGGASGSGQAPWIQAGPTYEFRLYAGTEHTTLLSKTQVTRSK
jgi:hypothetical protein